MTDKKIIKALERWTKYYCNKCTEYVPDGNCDNIECETAIAKYTLDLIKRQQAEIDSLKAKIKKYDGIRRYMKFDFILPIVREARNKAIIRFAERAKDILEENRTINNHYYIDCKEALNAFNNLVKEMTESEGRNEENQT